MPIPEPTTLAEAAFITPVGEGRYTAQLRADWCIGVVPHGGYLTTILLNASTHFFTSTPSLNQPHPIHASLTFVTRCNIGPVDVHVVPLKLGRQYSFVKVVLRQEGRVCIEAIITHANIRNETGVTLVTRGVVPAIPERGKCAELERRSDLASVFRAVTHKIRFWFPKDGRHGVGKLGPSVREQWVRLNDGSGKGFGVNDLGLLCDMFVPIPENYPETKSLHWYPTLTLTLDVKALPEKEGWEWLFVRVECGTIRGGRMDIDVTICDENSQIVAISRHVAVVVDIARNRKKDKAAAKL